MDASSRRPKPAFFTDENAVLPSKQASMAATHALQQARALEAPRLPRRAPLQPITQNFAGAVRPLAAKPEDTDIWPTNAHVHDDPQNYPANSTAESVPEALPEDIPEDVPEDVDPEEGDYTFGASDATIDDADADDAVDVELDDTELLAHHHAHSASFGDDEDALDDETQLRQALMRQPPAECNPGALFPIETIESRLTFEKCRQIVAETPGVLDAEDEDMWDASMVLEYSEDIFRHLRVMELRLLPNKGYMAQQKELNWTFRTVLIDWLVKIHFRFNLLPETLFLCVNYVDRFLSMKEVGLSRLQLVGAVGLFIAAKFEEINYLSIQEVSQIVENVYSHEEILKAERFMIDILDFNLGFPGPMSFLRRVSKADDYELETRTLAKYLLEVTTMDARFVAAPPSWCAAIAHYMSRHMLRQGPWTARHVYFSSYTEEQLMPGVRVVREALEQPQMHHQAVFEKYSERKFRKAALFVRNWMQLVKDRPEVDFEFL